MHALRVEIESHRHEIAIACAFAIAEHAALDPVGTRHQPEFRRGDPGTPVIMGVERDNHAVAARDVTAEIFDLVGIDIGRRRLDRCWQIEDQRFFRRRIDDRDHLVANADAQIDFGGGEGLG